MWGESMNRRKNLIISVVSAILAGIVVYGIHILLIRQIELQQTIEVVVPNQFIDAGTLLTEDMLTFRPVLTAAYDESMFTKKEQVAGQETMVPLGENEPILSWKIDRLHLMPDRQQATFQIPESYILSISNGIRAGDKVHIYVSGAENGPHRLFSEPVTVASVKTASNVEIDDPVNSTLLSKARGDMEKAYASRRNANGAIEQINLNLTEEQWLAIDRICRSEQAKLVIAYTSSYLSKIGNMEGAGR
jgi:hypothetical protein